MEASSNLMKVVTEGIVSVSVSSNVAAIQNESRFSKDLTVGALKGKLELITGVSAANMKIEVLRKETEGRDLVDFTIGDDDDEDSRLLGSYHVDSGMHLHVIDKTRPNRGAPDSNCDLFGDVSKVKKFELTEEEYSKRTDTVQSFLRRNNLGRYNKENVSKLNEEKAKKLLEEEHLCNAIKVGDRCEVSVPGRGVRRGCVRHVGVVEEAGPGSWVGVQYDEPLGDNNGTVGSRKYFECSEKFGGFVKPQHVKVGDYPEEEIDLSGDEM